MIKISVVIPVYNAEKKLSATLDALLHGQTLDKHLFEVIVVDNGSTDKSPEIAKAYPVIWQIETTPGPAAARNTGIRLARSPLIAFTDSDCVPYPDWLENLLDAESVSTADVFGGPVEPFRSATRVEKYLAKYQNKLLFPQEAAMTGKRHSFQYVITANAMIRKTALEKVGMFDERFSYAVGEDADLGRRLFQAGCGFCYDDKIMVKHWNVDNVFDLYRHFFKRGYYDVLNPALLPSRVTVSSDSVFSEIKKIALLLSRLTWALILFPFERPLGQTFFYYTVRYGYLLGARKARKSRKRS